MMNKLFSIIGYKISEYAFDKLEKSYPIFQYEPSVSLELKDKIKKKDINPPSSNPRPDDEDLYKKTK